MTGMNDVPGIGERAERAQRRRAAAIMLASLLVAGVMIAGTAVFKQEHGHLAPTWAVAFVLLYVGALALCWRACHRFDEVEIRHTVDSLAVGAGVYAIVYPAWYFLSRGGLIVEPDHKAVFVIVFAAVTIAYLWKKFR